MSRSKPSGLAWEPGEVYTLHFVPAYQHAAHYTGWAVEGGVRRRLVDHAMGRGANLTKVQREAGGSWILAGTEPGTRDREATLKERGASRRCRVCKAERKRAAGELTAAGALQAAGWDTARPHERNLLLQDFGLEEVPAELVGPETEPEVIEIWHPREPASEITPEQRAEMERLADDLIAGWNRPKDPEPDYEMEAG